MQRTTSVYAKSSSSSENIVRSSFHETQLLTICPLSLQNMLFVCRIQSKTSHCVSAWVLLTHSWSKLKKSYICQNCTHVL